jgi:PAS domain S-box-containing protein
VLSEPGFRQLAESLPQLVWTCRSDASCDYLSPQWLVYTGASEAEHLGFGWLDAVHPEDRERTRARWLAAASSVGSFDVDFRIRRHDGEYRWFRARAVPLKDEAGKVQKWIGTNTDIEELKCIENALRDSEARKDAILNSALDCIITMNGQGLVVDFNPAAERTFGYSRQEAVGRTVAELLIPPELRTAHWEGLGRALESGKGPLLGRRVEVDSMRSDGSRIAVELAISLTRLSGQPAFFTAYLRDISARKLAEAALRESEESYRTLVEQVKDYAIFRTDTAGRAITWNEGVRRVLGFDEHDFIGKDLTHVIFLPEDVRNGTAQEELDTAASRGVATNDRWMMRKDGTPFFAFGVTTALRDQHGRLIGFTKVMRDMTARKALEDALKEADRRKDEFIATLAHELRNPMGPIVNAAMLLRQGQPTDSRLQWSCEVIDRQVKHLTRLLHDLLDISRISTGKIELLKERLTLSQALRSAMESSQPLMEQRAHSLEVTLPSEPVFLHGDPVRLAQVFANLLNNSAKYTQPGGRIRLMAKRHGNEAVVSVHDNGMGIAHDKLPHVFDMFFQADGGFERAHGGLGIGLSLAKRLVEMHGGSIEARSEGIGKGSEFSVSLPIVLETAQPEEEMPTSRCESVAGRRIVVADDNTDQAETLAQLLRLEGNHVEVVHDGLALIEAAARIHPEAAIVDIAMPGLNGYEAARRIRRQPWGKAMKLIAQTGYGQEEDRRRALEAGFDGHLVKPADLGAMMKLLSA